MTTEFSAIFVDPIDGTQYTVDPNSQWLSFTQADGNTYWVNENGDVLVENDEGSFEYQKDDKGTYRKVDLSKLDIFSLHIKVNHTEQKKFSNNLYYSGGYQKVEVAEEHGVTWRSFEYTDPMNIARTLSQLQTTNPELYSELNLSAYHQLAQQKREQILAQHQRPPQHIEIDLADYQKQIRNDRKERFTLIKVKRDGKNRYIKLDNRRHGTDAEVTQAIAAEFFRRFFHAPKSRLLYAKGSNEVIGVETDELPGLPLAAKPGTEAYFTERYDTVIQKQKGLQRPCPFGMYGNYNIPYPQEIIDELVEAGLNEGYAVGLVANELDAHWGNFIYDPKTKKLARIDFDLTFAKHVFTLQQNPEFDEIYVKARNCATNEGFGIVAEELAEGFSTLDSRSAYRPHRWLNQHAFGGGTVDSDPKRKNCHKHPQLAEAIDANEQSKPRRYKVYLDMMLASEADMTEIVTPFTCDEVLQQNKIQDIKTRIDSVRQAMLHYPDFQQFLVSEKADAAIKSILAEKLDYYLDPLDGKRPSNEVLRCKIRDICSAYEKLTNKTVSEAYLNDVFFTKAGFLYQAKKEAHGNLRNLIFSPVKSNISNEPITESPHFAKQPSFIFVH